MSLRNAEASSTSLHKKLSLRHFRAKDAPIQAQLASAKDRSAA